MKTLYPKEYKVVALRECVWPQVMCDTPELAVDYWRTQIATDPRHNPDVESVIVVLLNARRRVVGHSLVATGTLDSCTLHAREVYRTAIVRAAAAIILMHNHPSGDPTPSEADIRVTRDFIRAGQLLKIELLDSVIVGHPAHSPPFTSLRALGYFT